MPRRKRANSSSSAANAASSASADRSASAGIRTPVHMAVATTVAVRGSPDRTASSPTRTGALSVARVRRSCPASTRTRPVASA